jgi:hypothetical protein
MNIGYHLPSSKTIYAQRTIYNGYRNAFLDLGHGFFTFTADDDLQKFLFDNKIDIFITASHFYYRKYLDYAILKKFRERGLVVFTKIDFWQAPESSLRLNEAGGMKDDREVRLLLDKKMLGDIFFHVVEHGDARMTGFEGATGCEYFTLPLAADRIALRGEFDPRFAANISFLGTYLPAKRERFEGWLFPLRDKYDLKIYGQDWTPSDRILGWMARGGQFFNIPFLRGIQKPKLQLGDEAKIYASSSVCVNIHEKHQLEFGGDCNERAFKIPFCGGFEITDDVACIRKYFKDGEEMIIAKDRDDWFAKIDFYLKNPEARAAIVVAGRERVLRDHTYHNRAKRIIELSDEFLANK